MTRSAWVGGEGKGSNTEYGGPNSANDEKRGKLEDIKAELTIRITSG